MIIINSISSLLYCLSFLSGFFTLLLIKCRPVSSQTYLVPGLHSCLVLHRSQPLQLAWHTINHCKKRRQTHRKVREAPQCIPSISSFCSLHPLSDCKAFSLFYSWKSHFLNLIVQVSAFTCDETMRVLQCHVTSGQSIS